MRRQRTAFVVPLLVFNAAASLPLIQAMPGSRDLPQAIADAAHRHDPLCTDLLPQAMYVNSDSITVNIVVRTVHLP